MTELEKTLLDAFDALSFEHEQQVKELQNAQASLQRMFETTSQENAKLQKQVEHLSNQVGNLSGQLRLWDELYSKKKT